MTMLMMKDQDGRIMASVIGLADRARVTKEECLEALRVFLSPDPDDTSKVEEGRRIREIQGGWEIINNDLYRFSTEERRLFWAQAKAAQRAKKAAERAEREGKPVPVPLPRRRRTSPSSKYPVAAEAAFVKSIENGEPVERQDAIVTSTLPEHLQ